MRPPYPEHNINSVTVEAPEYIIHRQWMQRAIALAQIAGEAGEVPVGAIIIDSNGNVIAEAENRRERDNDPTAHAEIIALRQAGKTLQNWHLDRCTLYVTLEPCPMCAGALVQARIGLLVYGADDPKTGAIRTVTNIPDSACSYHRLPVLAGILESTCRQQLQDWFRQKRGSRDELGAGSRGKES
ncbi:MAG: tRNA-specific adenosine deaminase [Chroococcidiopsis sp. SAG 2025]|nr:tRNA-specific adenosine deaminase [Chroococcidiopsis sp. SAG 2025]